ncbi:hypothetical protein IQ07DRAFT_628378 [Pyrenochaeta sp. DS3sAY3a]|nr:hypothetical protein IQ07DRAFT_628378 [Pyrenochaeta sp. DS3sAY3a]
MSTPRSRLQANNARGKDPARAQVQQLLREKFKRTNLEQINQFRWIPSTEGIVSEKLEVGRYGNGVVFAFFDPQGGYKKRPGAVILRSKYRIFKSKDPTPIELLKPFNILKQHMLRTYIKGLFMLRGRARGYNSSGPYTATNHHGSDYQTISPGHHNDTSRTRDGVTPTAARTISESPIEISKLEFLRGGSVLSPEPDIQTARTMANLASPNDGGNPRENGQRYSVETSKAMFKDSVEKYCQRFEALQTEKMELSEKLLDDLELEEHYAKCRMELKLRNEESMKALMKLLEEEEKLEALEAHVEDQYRKKRVRFVSLER